MLPRDVILSREVILRPPTPADIEPIARACADPRIHRFLPALPVPYTRDDAVAYLKAAEQVWEAGGALFAAADPGTDEWMGNIELKPLDARGNGEIGYLVAPWAQGRGVATAATRALTDWAFALGVRRLELLASVENLASQRVAMAAGFHREGVRRSAEALRDGTRGDLVAFARLHGESGERLRPFLPSFPGGSLSDGVVRLVPLGPEDTHDYHMLENLPDVVRYSVPPEGPDLVRAERLCRETGAHWLAGERAEMTIRDAGTGAFAGHIQLTSIVPLLGQAMTGYSMLPGFRGRGFMTRAVNLLVEWAFEHTALSRVVAGTSPANLASHRVLERAGFTREGLVHGLLPGPGGTRLDDLRWYRLRRGRTGA
ncbi:GNAT family N-acetyltransferase [Streptosporangium sp. NPDC051023]|uniref:GNAT family N-acetyltransferase n=1 Tax=Streptosporangium sp. NPDC051023 TaxID=3155410 RepID=UPI00344C3F2D